MQRVADALILSGSSEAQVYRQYVQALLDQGDLSAPLAVLEQMLGEPGLDPRESVEARGLKGRAYKQLYLASVSAAADRRRQVMKQAIDAYGQCYQERPDEHLWHGINLVALLARAERDGIAEPGAPDHRGIAEAILQMIEEKHEQKQANVFDFATAAEACVALGRPDEALKWTLRYTQDPYTEAFELASTLRQLVEVWGLDGNSEIGRLVLPVLQAELLKREGGEVGVIAKALISPQAVIEKRAETSQTLKAEPEEGRGDYEKVFGTERYVTLAWYQTGLDRCRGVVRLETKFDRGMGTGILLSGSSVHPSLAGKWVILTNAHVLSEDPEVDAALSTSQAVVTLEYAGPNTGEKPKRSIEKILWSSPPEKLDATLAVLAGAPPEVPPYPIAKGLPAKGGPRRVYAIGHPLGGGLSLSIHDNLLLDDEDPKLHYRTPTEPGSSGSPLFNDDWDLIGLHHAGSSSLPKLRGEVGTYEANEGIWIGAILRRDREMPRCPAGGRIGLISIARRRVHGH